MKKQILLFSLVFLVLITCVSATGVFQQTFPQSIEINCGESPKIQLTIPSHEDPIEIIPVNADDGLYTGMVMTFFPKTYFHPFSSVDSPQNLYLHFNPISETSCKCGENVFSFKVGETTYEINVETKEDLHKVGDIAITKGRVIDIGTIAHLGILEISDTRVQYILSGCSDSTEQGLLDEGNTLESVCSGEIIEIHLKSSYGEPFNFADFEIFSSESGLILTSSNESVVEDSSECKLGIYTSQTKVRRGKLLTFQTIDVNSRSDVGVPNVEVTIIDPSMEVPDYVGQANSVGFFRYPLPEEYKDAYIVISLKDPEENCVPEPGARYDFEQSYDDYKTSKQEEEGEYQLVLNMSEKYEMVAISGTIKNLLGNGVEGVEVKITKPDNSFFVVPTDVGGGFSFTPDAVGIWKLQGGKDDYQSTGLVSIEVFQNKEYLIRIKANGKSDFTKYKKNDKIIFELFENGTILPLTIDGTFAGLPIHFIDGISDEVELIESSTLSIPAIEGYLASSVFLEIKGFNWGNTGWYIGIFIGMIILLIIIITIIKKVRGGVVGKKARKMEYQLGEGGE